MVLSKRLLIAVIGLLALLITALLSWLWLNNRQNMDPLPVLNSLSSPEGGTDRAEDISRADTEMTSSLIIQAASTLRAPLTALIDEFMVRHPTIDVSVRYVPAGQLLELDGWSESVAATKDQRTQLKQTPNGSVHDSESDSALNSKDTRTDMLLADTYIDAERLDSLQERLYVGARSVARLASKDSDDSSDSSAIKDSTTIVDHAQPRTLLTFNYAIKDLQRLDGVILTDNPAATSLRNYILSSMGQDVFEDYGLASIEAYQNRRDELFNQDATGIVEEFAVDEIL